MSNSTNEKIIAIDGPAGSGKSTIAKALANRLNLDYLDTGAMYRAVAFVSIQQNIEIIEVNNQNEKVEKILNRSGGADLVVLGFDFDSSKAEDFEIYNGLGDMMFVYASQPKLIQ